MLLLSATLHLQSFLAVPIIASGSSGCIIGALSFGLTSIQDWGSAWWMSSIQLLCGWAAGALPQNRATSRACFFDALWSARDLDSLGAVFVHQLPHALVDQVGVFSLQCSGAGSSPAAVMTPILYCIHISITSATYLLLIRDITPSKSAMPVSLSG